MAKWVQNEYTTKYYDIMHEKRTIMEGSAVSKVYLFYF